MSSSATSARRSVCSPSASMPSSLVSRTRSTPRDTTLPTARVATARVRLWCAVDGAETVVAVCRTARRGGAAARCSARSRSTARARRARRARVRRPRDRRRSRRTRSSDEVGDADRRRARSRPSRRSPPLRPDARGGGRRRRRRACAFPARFHAGAEAMHRALFSGGSVRRSTLPGRRARTCAPRCRRARPRGALLPRARIRQLFHLGGGRLGDAARRGRADAPGARRRLAPLALVGGLRAARGRRACARPTRRRGARRAALGLALAGGVIVAGDERSAARSCSRRFDTSHGDAVVGTIWDAFLGDLRLVGARSRARSGVIAAAAVRARARAARGGGWLARVAEPVRRGGAARARRGARSCSPCCCCGCPRFRSISRSSRSPACWCSAPPPRSCASVLRSIIVAQVAPLAADYP